MRLSEIEARDMHAHEDDNPVVETERTLCLIRYTYKDGSVGWRTHDRYLTPYEQDCYEEAYELGVKSYEAQLANLRTNAKAGRDQAFADGVFVAAQAAYTRGPR